MIFVVLVSPFGAVYAQRKIDILREKRNQKLWVFRTLMATRGNRLSLEHVQALNSIELFFDEPTDKCIIEKWNEYLDHFNHAPKEGEDDFSVKIESWIKRGEDQLADLLQLMGKSLGANFDKVKLKRGFYSPKGHDDQANDAYIARKALVAILEQKSSLPIKITNLNNQ